MASLASRCFAPSSRQCLQRFNARQRLLPSFSQVKAAISSLKWAIEADDLQTQFRAYAIPAEEKIAKFKGQKGSDVWPLPSRPKQSFLFIDKQNSRLIRYLFTGKLHSHLD